jgi:hypothetical protein
MLILLMWAALVMASNGLVHEPVVMCTIREVLPTTDLSEFHIQARMSEFGSHLSELSRLVAIRSCRRLHILVGIAPGYEMII